MRTIGMALVILGVVFVCIGLSAGIVDDSTIYFRGDANLDGSVNASDPIYISNWLFNGGPTPGCLNQADANNDGSVRWSSECCCPR